MLYLIDSNIRKRKADSTNNDDGNDQSKLTSSVMSFNNNEWNIYFQTNGKSNAHEVFAQVYLSATWRSKHNNRELTYYLYFRRHSTNRPLLLVKLFKSSCSSVDNSQKCKQDHATIKDQKLILTFAKKTWNASTLSCCQFLK